MMIFHTLYRTALVYDGNGNLQSKDIGNRRNGVGSNNSNAMTYLNLGANYPEISQNLIAEAYVIETAEDKIEAWKDDEEKEEQDDKPEDIVLEARFVAKKIKGMRLTVVTNSLMVIDQLKDCDTIHLVGIGGTYTAKSRAFNGRAAVQGLKEYFLDKTFMSCRSLSMQHGITDSNEDIALIRQTLLHSSNSIYLIADKSKFDKTSFVHICDYEPIYGIISDYHFSSEWKSFLERKNVNIYECTPAPL